MNNNNTIKLIQEECCGCGACAYICPNNAIDMQWDKEGFACPKINENLCVSCGLCAKICAFQSLSVQKYESNFIVAGIKHKNEDIRKFSRSGGVFTAVSDFVLDKGGVIYGAAAISPKVVKHIRATSKEERDLMRGSKYVQSEVWDIYPSLSNDLQDSKKIVLFSGTPCQCAAVSSVFEKRKFPNLILCDFICHGVPSQQLLNDYLNWLEKKHHKTINKFTFRDKDKFSWESHVEKIEFENKTIYSRRYTNLFCSNYCLRESCYSCKYATMNRVADVTIGDFWGIDELDATFNDHKGVSVAIFRSEYAKQIFDIIKDNVYYFITPPETLKHYNLSRPTSRPNNRVAFWKDYSKKGFEYVSKKYGGYDLLRRIKNQIVNHIS